MPVLVLVLLLVESTVFYKCHTFLPFSPFLTQRVCSFIDILMLSSLNAPWVHVPLQVRPLTDFILGKAEQLSRYPAALSPCWYSILAPHLRLAQFGERPSHCQVTLPVTDKRSSGSHGLRPTTAAVLSSNRNRNAARRREFITGTKPRMKRYITENTTVALVLLLTTLLLISIYPSLCDGILAYLIVALFSICPHCTF